LINFRFQFLGPEVFLNWQFWVSLAATSIIITMLIFEAYFDLTYMLLPDFSSIILWLCSLILWGLKVFGSGHIIFENWIAMAMAGGFLLTLHLITRGKGMGMGDVIYALFMGFLLGYEKLVVAFYIAFIGGAVVGLILMLLRKVNKKQPIPFGPFLIAGTIIAWWFGEKIWILVTGMIL
ncbi:MAG TPA: A24 family peptidase, partial [Patescibacteria group bacterium]